MLSRTQWIVGGALALALGSASAALHAQVLTYTRGQPISAAYEGWFGSGCITRSGSLIFRQ